VSCLVVVSTVGAAEGARAAAAALACVGSPPDRAGLLVDLGRPRRPRPTLVAGEAARELEERLVAHLPDAGVAARGRICHLALPDDGDGLEAIGAALAICRGSTVAVHLPPALLQDVLDLLSAPPTGAVLRANLASDRALAGLAAGDLLDRGIQTAVLKRPLGWIASRRALAGALASGDTAAISQPACSRLLRGGL
jgi:hypothetical protein